MKKFTTWLILLLATVLLYNQVSAQPTAFTVGTGTPESCTDSALSEALNVGGNILFDCGSGPHTIQLSGPKPIERDTSLFGGDLITLRGSRDAIFLVDAGARLYMEEITITGGHHSGGDGGAVRLREGRIETTDVTFQDNYAEKGGAVYLSPGTQALFTRTRFNANRARGNGGAIFNARADLTLVDSTFIGNTVIGENGGALLYTGGGTTHIIGGRFLLNGALYYEKSGGAIYVSQSAGPLTIEGTGFLLNAAESCGGAIFNADRPAETTINGATFALNVAGAGGAICYTGNLWLSEDFPAVVITDSAFDFNRSNGRYMGGGAIFLSSADLDVRTSTFFRNAARDSGGAISSFDAGADVQITNSTFSYNVAHEGGGFDNASNRSSAMIMYSTFYNNRATLGTQFNGLSVRAESSIFANTYGFSSCNNTISYYISPDRPSGPNIQWPEGACGPLAIVANPMLESLFDNGGPTRTHALSIGSPAIDAAFDGGESCLPNRESDQRDMIRPIDGDFDGDARCDIGAFEVQTMRTSYEGDVGLPGLFVVVPGIGANVRKGPGTDFDVIDTLPRGSIVQISEQDDNEKDDPWVPVNYDFGPAWIHTSVIIPAGGQPQDQPAEQPQDQPAEQPQDQPAEQPQDQPNDAAQCGQFGLTSPLHGVIAGPVTFYWDPGTGMTGYRLRILSGDGVLASHDVPAGQTHFTADVSSAAIGPLYAFTWQVQALAGDVIVCEESVTIPRGDPQDGEQPQKPPAVPTLTPLPPSPTPQPQCGNGVKEAGETTCPNGY